MSKNKFKKANSYSSDSDEMMRMIKMLGIVVLILGAFYFIFAIASGEISFGSKKKDAEIQNEEILAGNTFGRVDSTYYVMYFDFEAKDSNKYSDLYGVFRDNYNTTKIYVVDLSKKFNSSYVVEDASQVDISSIETLKVVNGTLIKVEDGKAVSKAIGVEQIKKELFTSE